MPLATSPPEVSRPLPPQDEWVNVAELGIVGDNATDNTAKLKAAIDNLAKEVAEILGPSPQAEAYARRWICCAIEENYWCF